MSGALLGVLGTAGTLIGNGISTYANYRNNIRTNNANMAMAKYAHDADVNMWNRANEYNRPEAQMQRLKDAGLNPNMVYGNGTVTGNTSTQTPRYQSPNMDYNYDFNMGVTPALQIYSDMQVKKAQVDNMQAQNSQILQNTITDGVRAAGLATQNARSEFDLNLARQLERTSLQAAEVNLRNAMIDTQLKNLGVGEIDQRMRESRSRISLQDAQRMSTNLENQLRRNGVTSNDNFLIRALARFLSNNGFNLSDLSIPRNIR